MGMKSERVADLRAAAIVAGIIVAAIALLTAVVLWFDVWTYPFVVAAKFVAGWVVIIAKYVGLQRGLTMLFYVAVLVGTMATLAEVRRNKWHQNIGLYAVIGSIQTALPFLYALVDWPIIMGLNPWFSRITTCLAALAVLVVVVMYVLALLDPKDSKGEDVHIVDLFGYALLLLFVPILVVALAPIFWQFLAGCAALALIGFMVEVGH